MDCKRVTVIRIGPVISTRKRSTAQKCVVLFVLSAVYLNDPFHEKCVCRTPQRAANAKYK